MSMIEIPDPPGFRVVAWRFRLAKMAYSGFTAKYWRDR